MLQLADPFPPVLNFLHIILGTLGVLLAGVALAGVKGSSTHVRAGWGFVAASVIAAFTAIGFSVTSPSPLAVASALMVLALVASAVRALPLLYAAFPTHFLLDDRRFRRLGADRAARAYPRHLSRMAFAFAIAVHAPVVSFADDLQLDLYVALFGPFLLWPAILFVLRQHPRLQARIRCAPHGACITTVAADERATDAVVERPLVGA